MLNALLAQLVEQLTLNQRVEGSSPSWRTIFSTLSSRKDPGNINRFFRFNDTVAPHSGELFCSIAA
jgi:hypothetical protein